MEKKKKDENIVPRKKMQKIPRVVLAVMCVIILICIIGLAVYLFHMFKTWSDFRGLSAQVQKSQAETEQPQSMETEILPQYEALHEQNQELFGWIRIDGTVIDYPVMYTPDEPQRYLRKDFYGDYSHSGTPFLDERCTLDGGSLIIYGHNMKNDAMFSTLTQYVDADYLHEHPLLELETAAGCEYYRIFAVVLAAPTDEWYDSPAASPAELETLLRHIGENALYDTGCAPLPGAQLLTLSTCYYGGSGDERLLLVAYREEPSDD